MVVNISCSTCSPWRGVVGLASMQLAACLMPNSTVLIKRIPAWQQRICLITFNPFSVFIYLFIWSVIKHLSFSWLHSLLFVFIKLLFNLFLTLKVVDLSSHSFQTTDASGNLHRQDSWHRLSHNTSITPFLLAAQGSMGLGQLEGQTSTNNSGINDGGQPRRRRPLLSEADMSTALNCPACGKVFAGTKRRYHLERHLITHTGERPFPCPHCPYRANVRENLARHVRHRHPETIITTEETRT